jgi:hypothetical protein
MAQGSDPTAVCSGNNCGGAVFNGTPVWNAPQISPPSDNSSLASDAAKNGTVFSGTTTIVLGGTTASVTNCPSSCSTSTIDLTSRPIIYVQNGSGCNPPAYSTYVSSYSTSGCSGDVYLKGNYTAPVTIAAANNIIINGNLTTGEDGSGKPTGGATLGLIANQFVRVMHGVNFNNGYCDANSSNVSGQTFTDLKIDAAILAVQHSFIVDNFRCGSPLGTLTINGALAQYYRGAVGTFYQNGQVATGYVKNYNYDDRLKYLLPPYLFDISTAAWHLSRETLCTPTPNNNDPNTC